MAGRACLRRLRRFRDPRSRSLRGLRSLRRARAPAPRLVPYGVRGQNPARESRDAHPAGGCMARHARATAARWRWLSALIRTTRMNTVSRLVGGWRPALCAQRRALTHDQRRADGFGGFPLRRSAYGGRQHMEATWISLDDKVAVTVSGVEKRLTSTGNTSARSAPSGDG